jgi:enoyl-CoA hydratase
MDLHRYEAIDLARDGQLLIASFDRPEQLNAINSAVHRELETLFVDADRDDDIKLVILTGKGRAFSAGGDLDWLLELNADPAASARAILGDRRIQNALLGMETPIIAKVNGAAVGLGCSLALFCDVVVAASHAIFSDPHVSVGLVAGDGGALLWPQLIGFARARRYLLTGESIKAGDAAAMGLITEAVEGDDLDDVVAAWASRLLAQPEHALRWTKASINAGLRVIANTVLDSAAGFENVTQIMPAHREKLEGLRGSKPSRGSRPDTDRDQ